jgi:hypothetical protein
VQIEVKKAEIKIVDAERWPRLFFNLGVYDIAEDKIFVKGGLQKSTTDEIIEHEGAHEKWFKNNPRAAKILTWGWVKPAWYFIIAIMVGFLSIASLMFDNAVFYIYLMFLSGVFLAVHFLIWLLLEIPAWGVSQLAPKNVAEVGKSIRQGLFPLSPVVILVLLGTTFGNWIQIVFLTNLGVLLAWVIQLYKFFYVLKVLRVAPGEIISQKGNGQNSSIASGGIKPQTGSAENLSESFWEPLSNFGGGVARIRT